MKVGIYNQFLSTAGGGEKHMGAIAEYLAEKGHTVDILTFDEVDKNVVGKKLNLDFSKINVRIVPRLSESLLSDFTAEYDFFINATYLSRMVNKAPKSAYFLMFPYMKRHFYPEWVKNGLKNILGFAFEEYHNSVVFNRGFYNSEVRDGVVGRWSEKECVINVKEPCQQAVFSIMPTKIQNVEKTLKTIKSDNGSLKFKVEKNKIIVDFTNKGQHNLSIQCDFFVPKDVDPDSGDTRELGLFFSDVTLDTYKPLTKLVIKSFQLPLIKKISGKLYAKYISQLDFFNSDKYLKSYDVFMANSEYTKGWFRKIDNMDSVILYPPVDTNMFKPAEKEKIILSVGRFFVQGHNKKQYEMIKMFKHMYDKHPEVKDYEYHLCGAVSGSVFMRENLEYLEKCKEEAKGYPVFFHPDIPFNDLKALYSKAEIFWHAAGYQEDPELHPEKFEHFGITTVEAMSAGVIPVVIGMAGQKEVVQDGVNGYLWLNEKELITKTMNVILSSDETKKHIRDEALRKCELYSKEEFRKCLKSILDSIGVK